MITAVVRYRVVLRASYLLGISAFTNEERPEFEGVEVCSADREGDGAILSVSNGSQVVVIHDEDGLVQGHPQIWKFRASEARSVINRLNSEEQIELKDIYLVLSADSHGVGAMSAVLNDDRLSSKNLLEQMDKGSVLAASSESEDIKIAPFVEFPKVAYFTRWYEQVGRFTDTEENSEPAWINAQAVKWAAEFAILLNPDRPRISFQNANAADCVRILLDEHPEVVIFSFGRQDRLSQKVEAPSWVRMMCL